MIPEKVFQQILALGDAWQVTQMSCHEQEQRTEIRVTDRPAARQRRESRLAALPPARQVIAARAKEIAATQQAEHPAKVAARQAQRAAGKNRAGRNLSHAGKRPMEFLHHRVDQAVIALWLGHESVETTQMYMHADLRLKEKALERMNPTTNHPSCYRPNDKRLAFWEAL